MKPYKNNIETLINKLERYNKTLNKRQQEQIGLTTEITDRDRFNLLKKGWWSILFIGNNYNNPLGLRIFPEKTYKDWSVTTVFEEGSVNTLAPSLSSLHSFCNLRFLNDEEVRREKKEALNDVSSWISDFMSIVGGETSLSFYKRHLESNINYKEECIDQKIYIDFWKGMSKKPSSFKLMIDEIVKMKDDPGYLSTLDEFPEIWESRFKNILGHRSIHNTDEGLDESIAEKYAWQAFIEPHGFDTEGYDFNYYPEVLTPKSEINFLAEFITADYFDHAKEIERSPLYDIAKILGNYDNLNSYTGIQHFEAAAIFDRNLKKPLMAWKCLVSAAFWSGQNTKETYLSVWEAAIELCEAQNWKDAQEALLFQYNFYNDYKKQL